jgi:hypothetical protein
LKLSPIEPNLWLGGGRSKSSRGPDLARGPPVGHRWSIRYHKSLMKLGEILYDKYMHNVSRMIFSDIEKLQVCKWMFQTVLKFLLNLTSWIAMLLKYEYCSFHVMHSIFCWNSVYEQALSKLRKLQGTSFGILCATRILRGTLLSVCSNSFISWSDVRSTEQESMRKNFIQCEFSSVWAEKQLYWYENEP